MARTLVRGGLASEWRYSSDGERAEGMSELRPALVYRACMYRALASVALMALCLVALPAEARERFTVTRVSRGTDSAIIELTGSRGRVEYVNARLNFGEKAPENCVTKVRKGDVVTTHRDPDMIEGLGMAFVIDSSGTICSGPRLLRFRVEAVRDAASVSGVTVEAPDGSLRVRTVLPVQQVVLSRAGSRVSAYVTNSASGFKDVYYLGDCTLRWRDTIFVPAFQVRAFEGGEVAFFLKRDTTSCTLAPDWGKLPRPPAGGKDLRARE